MTLRIFLAVLLSASANSCTPFTVERAPIPDSTLVNVLVEFELIAARGAVGDEDPAAVQKARILARYGLTTVQYEEAMAFYADRPEAFLNLYNKVVDRLNSDRIPLLE